MKTIKVSIKDENGKRWSTTHRMSDFFVTIKGKSDKELAIEVAENLIVKMKTEISQGILD